MHRAIDRTSLPLRALGLSALAIVSVVACGGDSTSASTSDTEGSSDEGDAASASTSVSSSSSASVSTASSTSTDSSTESSTSLDTASSDDTGSSSGGPLCGNGLVDAGEDCDGVELNDQSCATLGFVAGDLACTTKCTFDTAACVDQLCGNAAIEGTEACDGTQLDGEDCVSRGFDEGTLACDDECAFDESGCVMWSCGNAITEGKEICDGADLGDDDCVSEGFDGGTLGCLPNCGDHDTSGCWACGDDVIGGPEICDGVDLGEEDCISLGFDGGTLACADDCGGYDTSGCYVCGDDVVGGPETCDGDDLAGEDCVARGFDGGTLACTDDCSALDDTACHLCGDAIVEGPEACEGADVQGQDCASLGFAGGTLGCALDCTFDTSECCAAIDYVDCDGEPGALVTDPFQALGINCGDDPSTTVIATNTVMNSVNPNAWRVMTALGSSDWDGSDHYNNRLWAANPTPWISPSGETLEANTSTAILALSTGVISGANAQGVVVEANNSQAGNGDNGNLDEGGMPTPLSPLMGSNGGMGGVPFVNCDGVNDCSDSLYSTWVINGWDNPNDKIWMEMDLAVPEGINGYALDVAYFSSEFPTWYNTQFNDAFVAWAVSESYTGNIAFIGEEPMTITTLEDANEFMYTGNHPALAGTGFETHAGTGWRVIRGPATAGESMHFTFFLADMADSILATSVLLDNFRWECTGCVTTDAGSCGLLPP